MPCEAFTLLSNDVAAAMLVASLTSEYCDQTWEVGGNTRLTIECVCPCGSLFVGDVSLSSSVVPECSVAEDRLPEEIDASDPVSVLPNK